LHYFIVIVFFCTNVRINEHTVVTQ